MLILSKPSNNPLCSGIKTSKWNRLVSSAWKTIWLHLAQAVQLFCSFDSCSVTSDYIKLKHNFSTFRSSHSSFLPSRWYVCIDVPQIHFVPFAPSILLSLEKFLSFFPRWWNMYDLNALNLFFGLYEATYFSRAQSTLVHIFLLRLHQKLFV